MDKYYTLQDETVEKFNEILKKWVKYDITYLYLGNSKLKSLVSISKVPDQFQAVLNQKEDKLNMYLLVTINEEIFDNMDDESINILFEEEISKIYMDDKGRLKLSKPNFITHSSLIEKYGIEKVSNAHNLSLLIKEQKEDDNNLFD